MRVPEGYKKRRRAIWRYCSGAMAVILPYFFLLRIELRRWTGQLLAGFAGADFPRSSIEAWMVYEPASVTPSAGILSGATPGAIPPFPPSTHFFHQHVLTGHSLRLALRTLHREITLRFGTDSGDGVIWLGRLALLDYPKGPVFAAVWLSAGEWRKLRSRRRGTSGRALIATKWCLSQSALLSWL